MTFSNCHQFCLCLFILLSKWRVTSRGHAISNKSVCHAFKNISLKHCLHLHRILQNKLMWNNTFISLWCCRIAKIVTNRINGFSGCLLSTQHMLGFKTKLWEKKSGCWFVLVHPKVLWIKSQWQERNNRKGLWSLCALLNVISCISLRGHSAINYGNKK